MRKLKYVAFQKKINIIFSDRLRFRELLEKIKVPVMGQKLKKQKGT